MTWIDVCLVDDIMFDRGVAALVGKEQVAIFRVAPEGELYAISNHDPFSEANVMSRGIVGSKGDIPKVASPIFKQTFDLRTGVCLEDPTVVLPVYEVRVQEGLVQVGVP